MAASIPGHWPDREEGLKFDCDENGALPDGRASARSLARAGHSTAWIPSMGRERM
jgi:hypothetical protein